MAARGTYYRALALGELPEMEIGVRTTLVNSVKADPTFGLPYLALAKSAERNQERSEWAAKGLCIVQPDTEVGRKLRRILLESLK